MKTQPLNECVESIHGAPTPRDVSQAKKLGPPLGSEIVLNQWLVLKRGWGYENILVLALAENGVHLSPSAMFKSSLSPPRVGPKLYARETGSTTRMLPTIAPCTQVHNAMVQSISRCLSASRERGSVSKGLGSRVRRHIRRIREPGQSDW